MIKSMTGFGKALKIGETYSVTVELRSVNSKGIDINLRMPSIYRNYEIELRNELIKHLERGKIDLSLNIDKQQEESALEVNMELAKKYHAQLQQLATELKVPFENSLEQVLRLPEVLKGERKEANEEDWKFIKSVLTEAIKAIDDFRKTEGESLKKDFEIRIHNINTCLEQIKTLDVKRVQTIKERISTSLLEAVGKEKIDQNRLEQELIYYIEKLDINEEKVRLKTHLDYFVTTMKEPAAGRKLNFIAQEIGREINTIGSKANDADIQKLVVLMKDELEKIKEQSSNVL
jgi:uncharacterized protein (TIGR00255 family)